MSSTEPRPLPPRALPPIQPTDGTQQSVIRTPHKRASQPSSDGTIATASGRRRRPPRKTGGRSPRSQTSENDPSVENRSLPSIDRADDVENGQRPDGERRQRTKRRKRPTSVQGETGQGELARGNPISSLIKEEDIVNVEQVDEAVILTNLPGVTAGAGGSAVADKVYFQTTNGFTSHTQDWVRERNKAASGVQTLTYGDDIVKASNIAAHNERGFMYLTLLAHGILAGISVWQVVVAYALFGLGESNFLTQYQSLAQPTQTAYYIILVFCVVSSMDRFDFGAKDKSFFRGIARFDLAAVSTVVHYAALMFSVGMAGLDSWLGSGTGLPVMTTESPIEVTTPVPLPPELTGESLDASSTVNTWLILNVVRAVLCCLGWLVIAVEPLRNDMKWDET